MPITPLIHITAAYSNALLVAVMPHISDYAKKLNLPIEQPVTVSQVQHFGIDNLQSDVGGGITLTNNYWFAFNNGYVNGFRINTNNPFTDDNPSVNWPKYAFGKDNMTTNQVMELARKSISKLGYDVDQLKLNDLPYRITGPYDLKDGNHVPYCEITWNKLDGKNTYFYQVQINMETKSLIGLFLVNRQFFQTNPFVSVTPQLEQDYQNRIRAQSHMMPMTINTNVPAILPH